LIWIKASCASFRLCRHLTRLPQCRRGAGQDYLKGQRHNDVHARMRAIAARLTPDEMERVTRYSAGIR